MTMKKSAIESHNGLAVRGTMPLNRRINLKGAISEAVVYPLAGLTDAQLLDAWHQLAGYKVASNQLSIRAYYRKHRGSRK